MRREGEENDLSRFGFFISFLFALPCHCIAYIILQLLLVLAGWLCFVDSKYACVQAKYLRTSQEGDGCALSLSPHPIFLPGERPFLIFVRCTHFKLIPS